jgi:hypothetical protein
MRARPLIPALLLSLLAGCATLIGQDFPASDTSSSRVIMAGLGFDVFLQDSPQSLGGVTLTVAKVTGPPLTCSQGRLAQTVAARFCYERGRVLNPASYGHFIATGQWIFEGGCI